MKVKTLVLLYTLVALLGGGVFTAKQLQNQSETSTTQFTRGEMPFSDLRAVAQLEIKSADQQVTLAIVEDEWVVEEREKYPVNQEDLRSFLRTLSELSIVQSLEAGPSFDARFGMDEESTVPEKHGQVVSLKDAKGAELLRLKVGKPTGESASPDPMAALMGGASAPAGRFIRLGQDPGSVYLISDPLRELSASPKDWLAEEFLSLVDPLVISLSQKGALEQAAWKVSRETPSDSFELEGETPEGKMVDSSKLDPLKNLLSYARFVDVVSEKAAAGLVEEGEKRRATIQTAAGLTYHLEIAPKKAEGTENYLMQVRVEGAETPPQRVKTEGESAEEAAAAEAQFQEELSAKREKLSAVKELEGRYFEVTSWTFDALWQEREAFFKEKPAAVSTARPPQSAVSPPLRVGP